MPRVVVSFLNFVIRRETKNANCSHKQLSIGMSNTLTFDLGTITYVGQMQPGSGVPIEIIVPVVVVIVAMLLILMVVVLFSVLYVYKSKSRKREHHLTVLWNQKSLEIEMKAETKVGGKRNCLL